MARNPDMTGQFEMRLEPGALALTTPQAACFNAISQGLHSKSQIAIAARLDLTGALQALDALARFRLVKRTPDHHWQITRRGRDCHFRILPDKKRRGSSKVGRGAQRLLDALDGPTSGGNLASRLGITKQRVHQLVVRLHAQGYLRLGDPVRVLHVIARRDDSTPLLSRQERRVFSAIAAQYDTTVAKIRLAVGSEGDLVEDALRRLVRVGLVAENKKANGSKCYQTTVAGSLHPQYRQSGERADPPPLPVRSDRVLAVLMLLDERGHAQITQVRDALGVPHASINALFQYLKRKSLVRRGGRDARSPYKLTDEGREALTEMCRRRAA
jgi:Mn-dependent DtxR family transcriptional regulator